MREDRRKGGRIQRIVGEERREVRVNCTYLPARVVSPVSLAAPFSTSTDMVPNR